jgi:phage portal protein BeeE
MNPTLLSRLHAAAALVFKSGAPFPFNKIMPYDATGGEKMYRAFEQSAWVMRAIKKIAGPIAAVDWKFTRNGQRFEEEELEAFWESPAAGLTRTDFIEATVGWLKLEGEAFWILDDDWLAPFPSASAGKRLTPLIVARPDRMRHVVKNGVLQGWEYVDGAGRRALLLPEQVIQTKMWNPYNEWRGMAELKPCHDAAEADFLAGKFNLNLMRNNGDQGVYVIAKSGMPTDTQRQQIVDQIREKRELAQRGVFKPVFLGGDVVIEDPKIRVPDGDFNATRL